MSNLTPAKYLEIEDPSKICWTENYAQFSIGIDRKSKSRAVLLDEVFKKVEE
jgi:hypothetical protein